MLALAEIRSDTCDGCGGYLPETTSAEYDGEVFAERSATCHVCLALSVRRDADSQEKHPQSVRYAVKKRASPT
jgi:hypothetical protein